MVKRGLSTVVTTLIIILLVLVAIGIIWIVIRNVIEEESEVAELKFTLIAQDWDIKKIEGDLLNPSFINISISGSSGKIILKNITSIEGDKGDIVFIVDSTGSMKDEIEDIKNVIFDFVDRLERNSVDYRLSLVDFKDYDDSPCGSTNYIEYPSQINGFSSGEFTTNTDEYKERLLNIIDSITSPTIGGDIPESHLTAINDSINLGFREESKKFVILLTDAPPHARDCLFPKSILDIVLVMDRSWSMIQSGWTLNTSLSSDYEFNDVNVPQDAYSSSYLFSVPAGIERLAIAINWDKIPGVDGSEGSEFVLNLRRPTGEWIFGSPTAVNGIVDPPDDVGGVNEYFSGISTKPQVVYIENPQEGNWEVKVYGWNLRPINDPDVPRPDSQNVDISVYMGDASNLIRNPTIISLDAAKSSAKNFVDNMKTDDRGAYVVFGSYAELRQSLTFDKNALKNAIDNTIREGGTAIQEGINEARNELSNARDEVSKVMVILTDGQNDGGPSIAMQAAEQAKAQGIIIFTIGLTGFVNPEMLQQIATKPEYYFYTPDASGLNEIYEQISQTLHSSFYTSIETTYEDCYNGPEYIQDIKNNLIEKNITFYYLNKLDGLCEDEEMKNVASATGGKFYSYTELQGVSDIILDLINVIIKNYERDERFEMKILFYNDTDSWEKTIYTLPQPLATKTYEISNVGSHITNITRIEIYLVLTTKTGKKIIGPVMDVWGD